jgi:excisionase family DNA binding protein
MATVEVNGERAPELEPLMNPAQVAEVLGVSASTVIRLRREGAFPTVMVGKRPRFRARDIAAYIGQDGEQNGNDAA